MNPQNQNQNQNQKKPDHLKSVNSEKSVPSLLHQLADDATSLFTKEIRLAKTEIQENVSSVKKGMMSTATGGAVLYAGVLTLLFSAVFGLATVVDLWLSALIIGAVVTIIGFAMLGSGKKKMQASSMKPDHSIDSMKADKRAVKGAL